MLRSRRSGFLAAVGKPSARDYAIFILLLQQDALDEAARRVFEDYQLVRYNSVDYFLLLGLRHVEQMGRLVQLVLATLLALGSVEHLVDRDLLVAASVFII